MTFLSCSWILIKWISRNLYPNQQEIRLPVLISFSKGLGKARSLCSSAALALSPPATSSLLTAVTTWHAYTHRPLVFQNLQGAPDQDLPKTLLENLTRWPNPFLVLLIHYSVFESMGAASTLIHRSTLTASPGIKKAAQRWTRIHYQTIWRLGYSSTVALSSVTIV